MDKFKVWCKNNDEWEKDSCVIDTQGILWQNYRGRIMPISKENHLIIPPTGVKDINKKESYLGDILKKATYNWTSEKDKHNNIQFGIVKKERYSNNMYLEWNFKRIYDGEVYWDTNKLPITHIADYEIVGDIYNNVELIKKEV